MRTPRELAKGLVAIGDSTGDVFEAVFIERDAKWRRLVEEAQQRSATWQHNHEDALRAVDEAQAETKRVNGELETELRQHAASYDAMRTERDRLKGELAEARRLIAIANYVGMSPATAKQNGFVSDDHRPIAAPPAGQAQPTYEDGEGRPAPLNAERLISAKPIKAAKAQGEGVPVGVVIAALAKRVDVIEEWARRQVAEPWFDPERRPAPPRPEGQTTADGTPYRWDGKRWVPRAVPPIPEGK